MKTLEDYQERSKFSMIQLFVLFTFLKCIGSLFVHTSVVIVYDKDAKNR